MEQGVYALPSQLSPGHAQKCPRSSLNKNQSSHSWSMPMSRLIKFLFQASVQWILLCIFIMSLAMPALAMDANLFAAMKWRLVGPFRGGRVLSVTGIPSQSNVYYFGAVAGGVWKTTDAGNTWLPLFDKEGVSSIGSIAIAPSDSNVIYVGTGEACIRNDISFGDGVYKSVNAGKTWTNVGLKETRQIGRVIVDPRNPDIVFVAALGHAFGPNTDRGVFRSADGGKTWQKVLYKDEHTGAVDITFDPNNSHILFATLWEAQRTPWGLVSGGPGSGLYRSTDGGLTWRRLEGHGLPTGVVGRIGVSVSAANSNRVYAIVEAEDGGLFRSEDGGELWMRVNSDFGVRGRPWYYSHVITDPKNADTVYLLDFGFHRSIDGGKTFSHLFAQHGDYHDLWIDPNNPERMIIGNDGGATITNDWGKTWTTEDNQPTAQFYHIAADQRFNYHLYGSQQDQGTVAIASRSDHGSIDRTDWYAVAGGESGYILPYPTDPNIVYATANYAVLTRFDKRTGQARDISPWPENLLSVPASDARYRFGWTPPILISPHDPKVLYDGAQVLFKTTDDGMTWSVISPDLTRNDKSKQKSSGGPITQDNTGAEYFDQISTIAESPKQKDLLWVGTDDGLIQLTSDGGKHWTNVTPSQMPEWGMVSLIEASAHEPGTAFAAVDKHKLDDFKPYVFRTEDFGKTWTLITAGIPETAYVHAVRDDPERQGLLYAGTETGAYVSFDNGGHWQSLQLNLPTSPIYDLVVQHDDLAIATHGRSFWVLDDLSPLRQATPQVADTDVFLYKPGVAYRVTSGSPFSMPGSRVAGENPPKGAIIDYFLKAAPKEKITLEILDQRGHVARKFSSSVPKQGASGEPSSGMGGGALPAAPGMNRFVWNLRYDGPRFVASGDDDDSYGSDGPLAVPGNYRVKLTVSGKALTAPLEIKLDPRVQVAQSEIQSQWELAIKIRDQMSEAHDAVQQMREVRAQLDALSKRLAKEPRAKEIVSRAKELAKKTTEVEEGVTGWKVNPNRYSLNYPPALDDRLRWLNYHIEMGDGAPNRPYFEVFENLSQQLEVQLSRCKEIISKDLAALNELILKNNIPALSVTPVAKAAGNSQQ
jgi:photosystem II stability/assembly factor-like uncharacterized protein